MRLLPLLALILFVASCKKATVLPDSIPMGESDAVEITYTGNVIEVDQLNKERSMFIDVNSDGVNDLKIGLRLANFCIVGTQHEAFIQSINSRCRINAQPYSDTTWVSNSYQETQDLNGNPMAIQTTKFSCWKQQETSPIENVSTSYSLRPLDQNGTLSSGDNFYKIKGYFFEMDSTTFEPTEFIVNGYPVFQSRHYINECANYPLDIFRYIGFRFEDEDGLYRLGWIRLNFQQDRIELNSWAIQPVE